MQQLHYVMVMAGIKWLQANPLPNYLRGHVHITPREAISIGYIFRAVSIHILKDIHEEVLSIGGDTQATPLSKAVIVKPKVARYDMLNSGSNSIHD